MSTGWANCCEQLASERGFHDQITAALQHQRRNIDLRGELVGPLTQRVDLLK